MAPPGSPPAECTSTRQHLAGNSAAAGDSSNAVALAGLQNTVSQRFTGAGGLAPGHTYGPSKLLGVDLSGASANTAYSFSVVGGAVTVTPPGTGPAAVTIGADAAGSSIFNIDTGVGRLTLSAPSGTTLAAAVAGLNGTTVTTSASPSTIGDQYAQQTAALGVEALTAKGQATNQSVLVNQLTTQRAQTSGVSLDEETINLMTYQMAYQAAARVITVMDSMLDTLINNTGRVGR